MAERLEPVDVLVIGSGMGGAAFCQRLAHQRPDLRIVCLERGGWVRPETIPIKDQNYMRRVLSDWNASPITRMASHNPGPSNDYPIDADASAIKPLMWNAVGGSTIAWAAHFPRLHPSDFRTRTLDGVGDDWPFTYDDLEPYYDLNDEIVGVCGLPGDPAYPPKKSSRMPPLDIGKMGLRAARGFNQLGWHWWPVDAAINTVPSEGRGVCNHCGPCQQGCIPKAKASVDITHWQLAMGQGVELRINSVAQHIETEGGMATGVHYRQANGDVVFQPAGLVAIAGNGIGTARLLLASNLGGDMVGRCLMFHPVGYMRPIFDELMDGPAGPIGNCIYSHEFYETDLSRGFVRGVQLQVTRENPLLTQSTYAEPRWGHAGQSQLRDEFHHAFRVLVMVEDLPELHNRVTLTNELADDGLPGIKLNYVVSENSHRQLEFGMARGKEMLEVAGARKVVSTHLAPGTGWHLLGTARMGDDPATSVTNGRGRLHTTPNVMVVDGSLMPTVGAVNPASTIGALAMKLADELATDWGQS